MGTCDKHVVLDLKVLVLLLLAEARAVGGGDEVGLREVDDLGEVLLQRLKEVREAVREAVVRVQHVQRVGGRGRGCSVGRALVGRRLLVAVELLDRRGQLLAVRQQLRQHVQPVKVLARRQLGDPHRQPVVLAVKLGVLLAVLHHVPRQLQAVATAAHPCVCLIALSANVHVCRERNKPEKVRVCMEHERLALHVHVVLAQLHVPRHAHVHHHKVIVLSQREPRRHHLEEGGKERKKANRSGKKGKKKKRGK